MKTPAPELINPEIIDIIRLEIEENDGNEVSFVGIIDRNGIVTEIEVMAYGSEDATPVVLMDALRGDVVIHNHPSGQLQASGPDIEMASLLANRRLGFYIIDNECKTANIINKPQPRIYLNENEIEGIFRPGGILSRAISGFESRDEQCGMVSAITDSVNDSRLQICEAGTGTGKSLSYLIPTTIWAVQNKKRVLIATHTINLQQQIAHKDMEIVQKVVHQYLGEKAVFAVLMGKGNYICKRRLYEIIKDREKQTSLFSEEDDADIVFKVEKWARVSEEGTRSEFGEFVRDDIWEEINCDSMSCIRKKCPNYSSCFYYSARLQAEQANVIIANHSLVFASIDETGYRSVLPFFSGVVFDEAHHIEDVALKALSTDFSFQGILYHLRKLLRSKRGKKTGLLQLVEIKGGFSGYYEVHEAFQAISGMIKNLSDETTNAFFRVTEILEKQTKDSGVIGIDDKFMKSRVFSTIKELLSDLFFHINTYIRHYENFANRLQDVSTNEEVVLIMKSITARNSYLTEYHETFRQIFETENEPASVKWIEVTKKNVRFATSPLEIGDFLVNSIFSKKEFSVFTSATLMINNKFDYFKAGTGLFMMSGQKIGEMSLPSPFNYEEQAEIFILNEDVSHSAPSKEKTRLVRALSLISEGGTLVLFTSYSRLREMYETLYDDLMENGLLPLKQGDKSRKELLDIMKSRPYVVLFATSSFWEGIDIQGENLRNVIIEKLPFDNPSDPIYKAKVALLESRGINPFVSYSVPRAVLRLKQGIGRLIRSKSDRGIITLMDNRIKTKRYGSIFLKSLPKSPVTYSGSLGIIKEAERFFIDD